MLHPLHVIAQQCLSSQPVQSRLDAQACGTQSPPCWDRAAVSSLASFTIMHPPHPCKKQQRDVKNTIMRSRRSSWWAARSSCRRARPQQRLCGQRMPRQRAESSSCWRTALAKPPSPSLSSSASRVTPRSRRCAAKLFILLSRCQNVPIKKKCTVIFVPADLASEAAEPIIEFLASRATLPSRRCVWSRLCSLTTCPSTNPLACAATVQSLADAWQRFRQQGMPLCELDEVCPATLSLTLLLCSTRGAQVVGFHMETSHSSCPRRPPVRLRKPHVRRASHGNSC